MQDLPPTLSSHLEELTEAILTPVSRLGALRLYGSLVDSMDEQATSDEIAQLVGNAFYLLSMVEEAGGTQAAVVNAAALAAEVFEYVADLVPDSALFAGVLPTKIQSSLAYTYAGRLANAALMAKSTPEQLGSSFHSLLAGCLRDFLSLNFRLAAERYNPPSRAAEIATWLSDTPESYEAITASVLLFEAASRFSRFVLTGNGAEWEAATTRIYEAQPLSLLDPFVSACAAHFNGVMRELRKSYTIDVLRECGAQLPAGYLDILRTADRAVHFLWPSQIGALRKEFLDRKRVAIAMPTSAGKTLLAEMKIAQLVSREDDSLAFYVVPLNALAKQVQRTLQERLRLAPLSLNIRVLTGTYDIGDEEMSLAGRSENVIITTPEKLDGLLRNLDQDEISNIFSRCRLFVFDECQQLGVSQRGVTYEFLIARLLALFPEAEFLALSAVFENVGDVASWIGPSDGLAIKEDWRPTGTHWGIVDKEGALTYDGKWSLTEIGLTGDRSKDVARLAIQLQQKYGNVLVLASTKSGAEKEAGRIATALAGSNAPLLSPTEQRKLKSLSKDVRSLLHEQSYLAEIIEYGVAYHHSQLPPDLRTRIEDYVTDGTLKFICSTTTLAQGLNFPLRCVIVPSIYIGGATAMSPRDIRNILGRAGRANSSTDGQVVVFRASNWVKSGNGWVAFSDYCFNPPPELLRVDSVVQELLKPQPVFGFDFFRKREALDSQLLGFLGQKPEWDENQLEEIASATFCASELPNRKPEVMQLIESRLQSMTSRESPLVSHTSPFQLTALGKVVRRSGVGPADAEYMRRRIDYLLEQDEHFFASLRDSEGELLREVVVPIILLTLSMPRNVLDNHGISFSAKQILGQSVSKLREEYSAFLDAWFATETHGIDSDLWEAIDQFDGDHLWRWINGADHLVLSEKFLRGKKPNKQQLDDAVVSSIHSVNRSVLDVSWGVYAAKGYLNHLRENGASLTVTRELDNLSGYLQYGVSTPGAVLLISQFGLSRDAAENLGSLVSRTESLRGDRESLLVELANIDPAEWAAVVDAGLREQVLAALSVWRTASFPFE